MKPFLVALALATFIPGEALAAPKLDDVAQAKAHFKKGTQLYRKARYSEAIVEFEAAYQVKPHAVVRYNLAQCHEKLGNITAGLKNYHDYLREAPKAGDRKRVLAAMANLERRLASAGVQLILVYSEPSDAEVRVDGQPLGRTPLSTVLPHGKHRVELVKPGYGPVSREAELQAGRLLAMELALEKAVELAPGPVLGAQSPQSESNETVRVTDSKPDLSPSPPLEFSQPSPAAATPKKSRLWTWVALGAAAAAAGAATYYGLSARNVSNQLTDGTIRPQAQAQSLHDDARSKSQTANVFLAVAGATGAAGVTLYFIEGSF